jgi:hypothetical protein
MSDQPPSTLIGPKDRVFVLMQEYNSLRTEMIHRHNNIYQLYAVAGGLFVWLLSSRTMSMRYLIGLGVSIVAFVLILLWSLFLDMFNAAKRVKEIEAKVNELVGEKLLVWEKEWGGS